MMSRNELLAQYAEKLNALLERLLGMSKDEKANTDIAYGYTRGLMDAGVISQSDANDICLACLRKTR